MGSNSALSGQAVVAMVCFAITAGWGCVLDPIDTAGAPCPCGPGWICCEAEDRCVPEGESCAPDAAVPDAAVADAAIADAAVADAAVADADPGADAAALVDASDVRAWGTYDMIPRAGPGDAAYAVVAMSGANAVALWTQGDVSLWANWYTIGSSWGIPERADIDDTENVERPSVAMGSDDDGVAVWQQFDGLHWNIWANRFEVGAGWGTAELIETDDAGDATWPVVAASSTGDAIAVWIQSDGIRDNVWANRYEAGTGWGTAALIEENDAGDAAGPRIGIDAAGNAIAVWEQFDGARWSIRANRYEVGTGWGTASPIGADAATDANEVRLAVDSVGNTVAVWIRTDGADPYGLWSSFFTVGSGWAPAEQVAPALGRRMTYPDVVLDSAGNAMAVWARSDCIPGAWCTGDLSVWASRYEAGVGWESALLIEPDTGNEDDAVRPRVAADGAGNVLVVWYEAGGGVHVWANRYVAGSGWTVAGKIENGGAYVCCPEVAMNAAGDAVAVWQAEDLAWANTYE